MKISYEVEIDPQDFWDAVFGCGDVGFRYWASETDFSDSILRPCDFTIKYEDEDTEQITERTLTIDDLKRGYELALKEGQKHCGGYDLDMEDPDACFGDMVIQYAIFNKLVYG